MVAPIDMLGIEDTIKNLGGQLTAIEQKLVKAEEASEIEVLLKQFIHVTSQINALIEEDATIAERLEGEHNRIIMSIQAKLRTIPRDQLEYIVPTLLDLLSLRSRNESPFTF